MRTSLACEAGLAHPARNCFSTVRTAGRSLQIGSTSQPAAKARRARCDDVAERGGAGHGQVVREDASVKAQRCRAGSR